MPNTTRHRQPTLKLRDYVREHSRRTALPLVVLTARRGPPPPERELVVDGAHSRVVLPLPRPTSPLRTRSHVPRPNGKFAVGARVRPRQRAWTSPIPRPPALRPHPGLSLSLRSPRSVVACARGGCSMARRVLTPVEQHAVMFVRTQRAGHTPFEAIRGPARTLETAPMSRTRCAVRERRAEEAAAGGRTRTRWGACRAARASRGRVQSG